jgi:hypothetical protein
VRRIPKDFSVLCPKALYTFFRFALHSRTFRKQSNTPTKDPKTSETTPARQIANALPSEEFSGSAVKDGSSSGHPSLLALLGNKRLN